MNKVLIGRYIAFVGSLLLAIFFIADWYVPMVSTIAEMNVDLPKAPPMFELSEPGRIEVLMSGAGFTYIQRIPIASAWRARRAEDIVELLNYGTVRTSLIIDLY